MTYGRLLIFLDFNHRIVLCHEKPMFRSVGLNKRTAYRACHTSAPEIMKRMGEKVKELCICEELKAMGSTVIGKKRKRASL